MNHPILSGNQKKRLDLPLWMLLCFAMFAFWQMGFIYFVGPSLTVDGKTPLPIDMDNATALIAACYVLSIFWMILLPKTVLWTQRTVTGLALLAAMGLFLPLPETALRLLIYAQIFCCCLMIGFETFVIVNYFSERTSIKHLTAAYGIAYLIIAALQNDILPVSFSVFRFITVGALVLLLVFFLRMPAGAGSLPRYIKKSDGLASPRHLILGSGVLIFVAALMGVSGPAIVGELRHGVSIAYLSDAIVCFGLYLLYRRADIHPFRLIPPLVGLGGIGFLLMLASDHVPVLGPVACVLIGFGMVPCQMLPLYGAAIMNAYPSKYLAPSIIGLALAAVLVQGGLVELFRAAPTMLCLTYAVIMAVLVFVYMQIEPFFLFALRRPIADAAATAGKDAGQTPPVSEAEPAAQREEPEARRDPLMLLTKKEREVAELICLGYTNGDIAKLLFISEHTVKDHTKKIYPKTGVHSRMELAALVGMWNADAKEPPSRK